METYPTYNAVTNFIEFGTGAAFQYVNDNSFGLFEKILHVNWENGGDAFQSGRQIGRIASNIQGVVEFVTGTAAAAFFLSSIPPTGAFTVGGAALTEGLCLPIGGIAVAGEVVGAIAGASVLGYGSVLLANNANNPLQIRGNGGSDPTLSYGSNTGSTGENSKILYKNMGVGATPGYAAHHIVPSTSSRPVAVEIRQILEEFNIDINDTNNGVLVTPNVNSHLNNSRYEQAVLEALQDAVESGATRDEIIYILQDIGEQIQRAGTYT